MNDFEAEQRRRQIEDELEQLGEQFDMDAACNASEDETSVVFLALDDNGYIQASHSFQFAPTLADKE